MRKRSDGRGVRAQPSNEDMEKGCDDGQRILIMREA